MKSKYQISQSPLVNRFDFRKWHILNLIYALLLVVCGITIGIILTSHLNLTSLSLNILHKDLSKFNKPPFANHDKNDNELLRRALMMPRIIKSSFDGNSKVAFMFLTKGRVFLAPLWEKFFEGNQDLYSIYVHSSPSYNGSATEFNEDSVFYDRRISSKEAEWGKSNMVEAEIRLLANALLDISNQHFVLLSESCIPLYNFSTIYTYLVNSKQTYVEAIDLRDRSGRGRYNHKMSPSIKLDQWRKGSQWFQIDRKLAMNIISDTKYFPIFQSYCTGWCYSDEHYLPTFVNIMFGEQNANRTLTWVDWSKGCYHPTSYNEKNVTIELLEMQRSGSNCMYNGRISNVCKLFARKFLPNSLNRLLLLAPKVMHFG